MKTLVSHFNYMVKDVLEHLWLVVLLCCRCFSRTLTTWASWTSVIATWTSVASAVIAAWSTVAVVTTWTSVSAWLTLRLYISLWLLKKSLA